MIAVFDLDDTLYEELTFVRSGFKAVAGYISDRYNISAGHTLSYMMQRLEKGREQIFDDMLTEFGLLSKTNVRKCVSLYRGHKPDISLYREAADCLDRLACVPVYIVTDGHKIVQKNKLLALGLYERVKFCFVTYQYGIKYSKPSPYCFHKICAKEKTTPDKVVYVGDNPRKDFVGIKPYGFKTIRVLTGQYREVQMGKEYEAHLKVSSLAEVNLELLRQFTGEH
ncbi:MAG: hypothetical protein DDT21_00925 [Syntrophomonadaceae bacterium]|nr:hypothetical protein [Bacillota bacterium]